MALNKCTQVGAVGIFVLLVLVTSTGAVAQQVWAATSAANHFDVAIGPVDKGPVSIGSFHRWTVSIRDNSGRNVENAQISIAGGMPEHGHGLPSQPLVTRYLGAGKYLIEGMLFNMAGSWTLLVNIHTASLNDQARFDISLNF